MSRRVLIATFASLFFSMPVWADPAGDFMTAHPEVSGLGFDTPNDVPTRISFINGTSEITKQLIRNLANSFNWTPSPKPDPTAFQTAIMDKVGSGDLDPGWINYLTVIFSTYKDPGSKAYFAKITGATKPDFMTQAEIDLVAEQAVQANMPLR